MTAQSLSSLGDMPRPLSWSEQAETQVAGAGMQVCRKGMIG